MNESESSSLEILKSLSFCAIDLETTGGDFNKDQIFEVGLVKIENLKVTAKKEFKINPSIKIPPYVQRLTSTKPSDLKGRPLIEEVIDEIVEFIGDDILLAHNVGFDVPFLNSVLRKMKRTELSNKNLCTNVMTKFLLPETTSSNLTFLSDIFHMKNHSAHRALSDAKLTSEIFIYYMELMAKRGLTKVNQMYYPKNRFELDRISLREKSVAKELLKKLIKTETPFTITFKTQTGLIFSIIPCQNNKEIFDHIQKTIENDEVHTVSIRIFGSYLRALISFKEAFLNINKEQREQTLEIINNSIPVDQSKSKPVNSNIVLVPHLMRNQYIAYDGDSLSSKKMIIFRFPGQEKKCVNYINKNFIKKSKRIGQHAAHKDVNTVIMNYILKNKDKVFCVQKKSFPRSLKVRDHEILTEMSLLKRFVEFPDFHL